MRTMVKEMNEAFEGCLGCAAQASCVFVGLTREARREFRRILQIRTYSARSFLVRQGDPVEGVFVVREGMVRLLHLTPPGKIITVHLAGPGEILGLSQMVAGTSYPWDAQGAEKCTLEFIPRADFLAFLHHHPEVTLDLLTQVSQDFVKLQGDLCATMSGSPLRQRLLDKLRQLCEEWGVETERGLRLDLHVTVQDLADHVGCSRQWVSKSLGELERDGLVQREGRTLLLTPAASSRRERANR